MIQLGTENPLSLLKKNRFGEEYIFEVNRNDFEKIDFASRFKKEFKDNFLKEDTLFLIIGTDSGLLVNKLLEIEPNKGSAFIFIEFPEIIKKIEQQYDLENQQKVIITTQEEWFEQAKQLGIEQYFFLNKIQIVKSFAAKQYYLNEYLYLAREIDKECRQLAWNYTASLGSQIFIQRQLENLNENHTPAKILKNVFKGKSALILAGGPSLDDHLDWIEKNQKNYVVIAVSRIAKRLMLSNIVPDIFVSVDPQYINYQLSMQIHYFSDKSILINKNHINNHFLGLWEGKNLYLDELFPWSNSNQCKNITGTGPTVTNSAIYLALELGIKEQILIGVDFCYSQEGFSHASGNRENKLGPELSFSDQIVTTYSGKTADTDAPLFDAIQSLSELALSAQHIGCRLINPSPDAAKVENVSHIPIDQINIPANEINAYETLCKLIPDNDSLFRVKHYNEIQKELKKTKRIIQNIYQLTKKGLEYNQLLFKDNNPEKNFKYKIKMDKLEKELNNDKNTQLSTLSIKFGAEEFLKFIKPDPDRDWTNEEIKTSGQIYYSAFKAGAKKIIDLIDSALLRTEIRLEEENSVSDPEALKKKWLDLDHSNRIAILKHRNPELFLKFPKEDQDIANGFYELIINYQARKPSKKSYSLEGVDEKLYDYFTRNDEQGLLRMVNGLKLKEEEKAVSLFFLGKGYLAELKMQFEEALNCYEQISHDDILESSLKRLAHISLETKDLGSAETFISSLSLISPIYLSQLAELYNITKNYQNAADTYTQYLDHYPTDTHVMMKLGIIYIEQNITEGAIFLFKHILQHEPENKMAQTYLKELTH